MSQTSHLKSTPVTNLDAIPLVSMTTGEGSSGFLRSVEGFVTTVAADLTGSTYQLVRLPSNAKLKHLFFEAEAQGAGKVDLSLYYSSSTQDGTAVANQGLVVPTTGAGLFAIDIDCASIVLSTDEINQSANYPLSVRQQPLWQAAGLTTDPGGYFDIVAVVHTTAITTGAARLGVSAEYVV